MGETSKNETFVGPFLTKNEYVNDIRDGIAQMDISMELRTLYLNKWMPPMLRAKEFVFARDFHITTHDSVWHNFESLFSKQRFAHSIVFRVTKDWWFGIIIGFVLGIAYVIRYYVFFLLYRVSTSGVKLCKKMTFGTDDVVYQAINDGL